MLGHSDNDLQERIQQSNISIEDSRLEESNLDSNPEDPIIEQASQVQQQNRGVQPPVDPVKAHIRQILRNQKLASQMTEEQQTQAEHEAAQRHLAGQGEEQQNLQEQVRQHVQKQVTDIKKQLNDLKGNTGLVKAQKEYVLINPDFKRVYMAYQKTGFEFADSGEKRLRLLKDCDKRAKWQRELKAKIDAGRNAKASRSNISLEKAITLSDEYLSKHVGEFQGEGVSYIEIRYNLMKNPYYSLLPPQELKLSRYEVIKKLTAEYKRKKMDVALVSFYQDIIRLRNIETAEANRKARKEQANQPTSITEKERKSNKSYRVKIVDQIYKNKVISKEEKIKRGQAVGMIMDDLTTHLWDDVHKPNQSEKRNVTPEKREGVRQILAWMYRNCQTDRGSMEPFIYKLTQAKPDQLLHMFYMIEYDLYNSPNAECYHSAVTDYVPDLKNFTKKANWNRIGDVAKFVYKCDQINEYMQLEDQEEDFKQKLDPGNENHLTGAEADAAKFELIKVRYNKIINMYKTAGLEPGMSVELVEDPKLKERIVESAKELIVSIVNLSDEQIQLLDREVNNGEKTDKKISAKNQDKKEGMSRDDIISDGRTIINAGLEIKDLFKAIGEKAKSILEHGAYVGAVNGLSEAMSLVGIVTNAIALYGLGKSAGVLTQTDFTVKQIGAINEIFKGGSGMMSGIAQIINHTSDVPVKFAENWIGKTTITPITESGKTLTGAMQFGAGMISIGAGGVQMVLGNMERKQAVKSKQHLTEAERQLNQYDNETQNNMMLSEDDVKKRKQKYEHLKAMMQHRSEMVDVQKTSATMKMVTAGVTMFGGVLTTTGLLAPIGGIISIIGTALNIYMGMYRARKKKNEAINKAVDEGLKLDQAVDRVKSHFNLIDLKKDEEKQLRNDVRSEALAELDYPTSLACYYGTMKDYAEVLYNNVLEHPAESNSKEYKMFYEMLLALKFKPEEIKRAVKPHERHQPSISRIYSRLTEG